MVSFDFTKLLNIGKALAYDLEEIGVKDLEEMQKLGTEEIFWRHFQVRGG